MMTLVTLLPAGWLSHLANLARPASELGGPEHLMAWYPLSDILLHLCAPGDARRCRRSAYMIGYGPELIGQMVDALFGSLAAAGAAVSSVDASATAQTKSLLLLMLPAHPGRACGWSCCLRPITSPRASCMRPAARLRPREDIPSALRMNRNAIFIFLAGLAATFFGGVPAMIGATVVGTFGAGFLLSGFAALHFRTRGKDWRLPALILCYLASLILHVASLLHSRPSV